MQAVRLIFTRLHYMPIAILRSACYKFLKHVTYMQFMKTQERICSPIRYSFFAFLNIYLYTYVYMYIYIHVHTYMDKYVHVYMYMYIHMHMHMHINIELCVGIVICKRIALCCDGTAGLMNDDNKRFISLLLYCI